MVVDQSIIADFLAHIKPFVERSIAYQVWRGLGLAFWKSGGILLQTRSIRRSDLQKASSAGDAIFGA